jgi:hypothetical protein
MTTDTFVARDFVAARRGPARKWCVMTLPVWNNDWEKPDRLRGKHGWTCPDYVNISAAVVLVVTALGLLVPAVPRAKDTDARVWTLDVLRKRQLGHLREQDLTRTLWDHAK